ncbi:unnamed protein product [Tilletia caries]|nr:unnamed protein product [Tilletia caries]
MNVQIVNDHQMNIIDFSVGRTGSRCDSVAFEDTRLAQRHSEMLEAGEWCWADAGYKRQDWLVLPFTRPLKDPTHNRHFNYHLSRIRISSEHTIGWLKGRFQCLKELRDDVQYACLWLRAAVLLHQTAKWVEQGDASMDPFYAAGTAWEAADRGDQAVGARNENAEEQGGTGNAATGESRARQLARAHKFRDGLMAILCKAIPPRQSRRTF